jgi:hypothetical protein
MKIAIVHLSGSVGSWRWLHSLIFSVLKYYPDIQFSVFYKPTDKDEQRLFKELTNLNISMHLMPSSKAFKLKKLFNISFLDNI